MLIQWQIDLNYANWQLVVSLRLFITDSIAHSFFLSLELIYREAGGLVGKSAEVFNHLFLS